MKRACQQKYLDGEPFEREVLDPDVKAALLSYMRSIPSLAVAAGYFEDVTTGKEVIVDYLAYNDGEFSWTTCDIYHLKKYDLAMSPEFVEKALRASA